MARLIGATLLTNAAVPLTTSGGWRGPANLIAVGAYLADPSGWALPPGR